MSKQKRKFGDRKDGRRIRNLHGMEQLLIDIKPNRSVSDVYINQKMDLTNLVKFIEKQKEENKKLTYFHAFVTAFAKTIYNRPKLNRFIANRHVYEHYDVVISFVGKVKFEDNSGEMMTMIPVLENDNIETVGKKIIDSVDSYRNKKEIKKIGANKALDVLGALPNIIRIPIMGVFKMLDQKGLMPKSLMEDNLYYSSLIVSNLGSIKCGAICHNISDFGACSGLATMGEIKDEEVIINGKKEIRKICEFGINLDERIADGYYFAKSVKLLKYILENPELLLEDAGTKIDVNEIR